MEAITCDAIILCKNIIVVIEKLTSSYGR